MDEAYHTKVSIIVEEIDANGKVVEETSRKELADFPDDQNEEYAGMQSDNFFNEVIRKVGRV